MKNANGQNFFNFEGGLRQRVIRYEAKIGVFNIF